MNNILINSNALSHYYYNKFYNKNIWKLIIASLNSYYVAKRNFILTVLGTTYEKAARFTSKNDHDGCARRIHCTLYRDLLFKRSFDSDNILFFEDFHLGDFYISTYIYIYIYV